MRVGRTVRVALAGCPDAGPRWDLRGPRWDLRGPSWDLRGPRWDLRGPSWDLRGPSWDLRGPSWDLRGPRWDLRGSDLAGCPRRAVPARRAVQRTPELIEAAHESALDDRPTSPRSLHLARRSPGDHESERTHPPSLHLGQRRRRCTWCGARWRVAAATCARLAVPPTSDRSSRRAPRGRASVVARSSHRSVRSSTGKDASLAHDWPPFGRAVSSARPPLGWAVHRRTKAWPLGRLSSVSSVSSGRPSSVSSVSSAWPSSARPSRAQRAPP